jgi:hypothetical protein
LDSAAIWARWAVPKKLKSNKEVVMAAAQEWGSALGGASDELLQDRDVVEAAVRTFGPGLHWARESLQKDAASMGLAIRNDHSCHWFDWEEHRW